MTIDEKYFPGFTQKWIETEPGIVINTLIGGSGKEAVLLVHGHPETHLMWRFLTPELTKHYTVVITDLRGYGDSSKPEGLPDHSNYSKRALADDQVKVMQTLGYGRFHVAGHDRGARVLHRMIMDHPEKIKSCTLMDIIATYDMYKETNEEFATKYWHWFFYIQGNTPQSVVWGDSKAEVVRAANIKLNKDDIAAGMTEEDMVKSFTLLTGTAAGNRKLVAATRGQSIANLHNVGGEQRSVLAEAYFGPIDNEELNVTKQMIRDIASNPYDEDETMYGTMDVSGGNADSDDNPFIAWKGHTIVGIEFFRGDPKELVAWISQMLGKYGIPKENFAFDATGLGNYLRAYTSGWPVTANKTAMQEYDEQGNQVTFEQYFNLRSQLMSKLEVALKTGKISATIDLNMRIPYGKKGETRQLIDVLYDESNTFRTLQKNKRIYYRSKDEYRAKFHSSPNIIDTMYLRMIWDLDARPKKQPAPEIEDDAYDGLYNDYGAGRSVVWV